MPKCVLDRARLANNIDYSTWVRVAAARAQAQQLRQAGDDVVPPTIFLNEVSLVKYFLDVISSLWQ
jgi:hypothetical protein